MIAEELNKFILGNFGGVMADHPWESAPEFMVFRHAENRKWFALKFYATLEQLLKLKPEDEVLREYASGARVEIVNVKIDPEMISDIVREPGFLPGYHMNRKYWVSIVLSREVDAKKAKALIEMSYNLSDIIKERRQNV